MPWTGAAHVWWGDERFVAADDDDRNAKQAREAWYGKLVADGRMPAGNIHAMPSDERNGRRRGSLTRTD
ncbi:MAG: 6-phosphogluconolactonase [Bifidobacterium sp.]